MLEGGGCVSHHAQPPASDSNPYLRSTTPVERGCHPSHITIYFLLYPFPNCSAPAVVLQPPSTLSPLVPHLRSLSSFPSFPIARFSFNSPPLLATRLFPLRHPRDCDRSIVAAAEFTRNLRPLFFSLSLSLSLSVAGD